MTLIYQPLGSFLISLKSLGLNIWSVWSINIWTFVPIQTVIFKDLECFFCCSGDKPFSVGVFYANNELSTSSFGVSKVS